VLSSDIFDYDRLTSAAKCNVGRVTSAVIRTLRQPSQCNRNVPNDRLAGVVVPILYGFMPTGNNLHVVGSLWAEPEVNSKTDEIYNGNRAVQPKT
jgi:hypothetical protein